MENADYFAERREENYSVKYAGAQISWQCNTVEHAQKVTSLRRKSSTENSLDGALCRLLFGERAHLLNLVFLILALENPDLRPRRSRMDVHKRKTLERVDRQKGFEPVRRLQREASYVRDCWLD